MAVFFTLSIRTVAQAPSELWTTSLGSASSLQIRGIVADSRGDVFVGGEFVSEAVIGTDTLRAVGGNDLFVVKINPRGRVQWAWTTGGQWDDDFRGITSVSNAAFVVGNIADSTFFDGLFPAHRMMLASLSSDGRARWITQPEVLDKHGSVVVRDVADRDSMLVVTGRIEEAAVFDEITVVSGGGPQGGNDIFVVMYDTSGVAHWGATAGNASGEEFGWSVAIGDNQVIHVSGLGFGTFEDLDEQCEVFSITSVIWIGQLSVAGHPIREECIYDPSPGGDASLVWDMAVDGSGGLVIAGGFTGRYGDSYIGGDSALSAVLARLDPKQDLQWSIANSHLNSGDVSIGFSVEIDEKKRIHLSRLTNAAGRVASTVEGYDLNGGQLYSMETHATGYVAADGASSLYHAVGNSVTKFSLNGVPVALEATRQPVRESTNLSVYPNPMRSHATFVLDVVEPGLVEVKVFDLLGREVDTVGARWLPAGPHYLYWQPKNLAPGAYVYAVFAGGDRTVGTVLVE